MTMNIDPWY